MPIYDSKCHKPHRHSIEDTEAPAGPWWCPQTEPNVWIKSWKKVTVSWNLHKLTAIQTCYRRQGKGQNYNKQKWWKKKTNMAATSHSCL